MSLYMQAYDLTTCPAQPLAMGPDTVCYISAGPLPLAGLAGDFMQHVADICLALLLGVFKVSADAATRNALDDLDPRPGDRGGGPGARRRGGREALSQHLRDDLAALRLVEPVQRCGIAPLQCLEDALRTLGRRPGGRERRAWHAARRPRHRRRHLRGDGGGGGWGGRCGRRDSGCGRGQELERQARLLLLRGRLGRSSGEQGPCWN
mmetsp:Transcript_37979/g.107632  ORF Transcript_37979/g.107632 Transcript_37979/m.107632 type:complete len:207 (+) Transcript_37979:45-665(+)